MKKIPIGRFIDPLTDFGFKRLFGSEPNKDLLIDFLNQVLKGRKEIIDLSYNKNEEPGFVKDSRKCVFDLRCTGPNGEQFIIEVQKVEQTFFIDRCVYYTSALIHDQGPKGGPDWDYRLQEVYLIGLMDFAFDSVNKQKYLHDVALMDRDDNTVFYNKLGYTFIEVPKFDKAIDQLETVLDKWLYVLKNINNLDKIPVILRERIFVKLFKLAETANLTKEEHTMYEASLMQKWDYQNGLSFAEKKGWEKGRQEGRQEGREEGREEGRQEGRQEERQKARMEKELIAKSLKEDKLPLEAIAKATGLSIEEIGKL